MHKDRPTFITELIRSWSAKNPKSANAAMQILAEEYLENDKFKQGPNEEVSLTNTDNRIRLRVTRKYSPRTLED